MNRRRFFGMDADACFARGKEFWAKHEYQEAVTCFNRGLEIDPHHPGLTFWLGDAYLHGAGVSQDKDKAFYWFQTSSSSNQGAPLWCENCHWVHGPAPTRKNYAYAIRGVCPLCEGTPQGSPRTDKLIELCAGRRIEFPRPLEQRLYSRRISLPRVRRSSLGGYSRSQNPTEGLLACCGKLRFPRQIRTARF